MQVRHNKVLVGQSLSYCLHELDSAEHPIPYLLHPIYGSQHGADAVYQGICTHTANNTYGNRPIDFEIPKPLRSSTRTLHRLDVLTSAEYHVLARSFAKHSKHFENEFSASFKLGNPAQALLWAESSLRSRDRWIEFQNLSLLHLQRYNFCQVADIETFFDVVHHDVLHSTIYYLYKDLMFDRGAVLHTHAKRLFELLNFWFPTFLAGLPQGPSASFFFAELLLLSIDQRLDSRFHSIFHYVDDYRITANTENEVKRHFEQLEAMLEELKLKFNPTKLEFDVTQVFSERILRLRQLISKYETRIASIYKSRPFECVEVAVTMLQDELLEGDIDRYWVNYLIGKIRFFLSKCKRIKDELLNQLLDCFDMHKFLSNDALLKWRSIFSGTMEHAGVQELLGEIVRFRTDLLPTERAFIYGCYRIPRQIDNEQTRKALVELFERDAAKFMPEGEWSGSEAALIGKALRAAQRHGKGTDILMTHWNGTVTYPEMRRYAFVAGTDLSDKQRREFYANQFRKVIVPETYLEERYVADYLDSNGEPDCPDARMPSVSHY